MKKLDRYEREVVAGYEKAEPGSVPNLKREVARYREYAKATFRKNRRVNIRISEKDLDGIQRKAVEEGLPYQTLMSSVLHKFITGRLTEKTASP
jgi:predicted DNA binding CopG/RHH family protein